MQGCSRMELNKLSPMRRDMVEEFPKQLKKFSSIEMERDTKDALFLMT